MIVNPWFDPATNSAKVSAFEGIGLYRANYAVTGTFNSNPFPISAAYINTSTIQSINATQVATAP